MSRPILSAYLLLLLQATSGGKYLADGSGSFQVPVLSEQTTFAYDSAGNGGDSTLCDSNLQSIYIIKGLNQYKQVFFDGAGNDGLIHNQLAYDADGNLVETRVVGDANCNGVASVADINALLLALTDPAAYAAQHPGCNHLHGDMNAVRP